MVRLYYTSNDLYIPAQTTKTIALKRTKDEDYGILSMCNDNSIGGGGGGGGEG